MASSHKARKVLAYIGMPALFCAVGYVLLFLALQPVYAPVRAWAGLLIADQAPSFDDSLKSIYDPEAEKIQPQEANYIDSRDIEFPMSGTQYAQVTCEEIGLDAPVYWHDSDEILMYGVGQMIASMPPGFGSAIVLSGHNNTFFTCLQYAAVGNVIKIKTNYCDYEYKVTKVQVYPEKELGSIIGDAVRNENKEELIMYTCYPFHVITGRKTQRLTVFADRISGTDVKWKVEE